MEFEFPRASCLESANALRETSSAPPAIFSSARRSMLVILVSLDSRVHVFAARSRISKMHFCG
jgi:hypothetical protein